MKNQYFGDLHDYRKYGLLRCLLEGTKRSCLVAWMLTPDDGSSDGLTHKNLAAKTELRSHDPELYDGLVEMIRSDRPRAVSMLEEADLLGSVDYYSKILSDDGEERSAWFQGLRDEAKGKDLVFLDPDIGISLDVTKRGHKGSSQYVFPDEISRLWFDGCSLLIYQHFPRRPRAEFIPWIMDEVHRLTCVGPGRGLLIPFVTPHVLFILAVQKRHWNRRLGAFIRRVNERWGGQISTWEPECPFCAEWAKHRSHADTCVRSVEDKYPVTEGHTLVIPRRHVASFFELRAEERTEMWETADGVCKDLSKKHNPDGFNIGINIGEAAGQTIDHGHIHVIPRYKGDVEDPTGGVRDVIPAKQNYWKQDEQ